MWYVCSHGLKVVQMQTCFTRWLMVPSVPCLPGPMNFNTLSHSASHWTSLSDDILSTLLWRARCEDHVSLVSKTHLVRSKIGAMLSGQWTSGWGVTIKSSANRHFFLAVKSSDSTHGPCKLNELGILCITKLVSHQMEWLSQMIMTFYGSVLLVRADL